MGTKIGLGRSCPSGDLCIMDALENKVQSFLYQTDSTLCFEKTSQMSSKQLHGFSDASEQAYAAVLHLCAEHGNDNIQTTHISSKSRWQAPMKRLTILRLKLCGARILAQLLHKVRLVLWRNLQYNKLVYVTPSVYRPQYSMHCPL